MKISIKKKNLIIFLVVAISLLISISSFLIFKNKETNIDWSKYSEVYKYRTEETEDSFSINTIIKDYFLNSEDNTLELTSIVYNKNILENLEFNFEIPFENQNLTVEEVYAIQAPELKTLKIDSSFSIEIKDTENNITNIQIFNEGLYSEEISINTYITPLQVLNAKNILDNEKTEEIKLAEDVFKLKYKVSNDISPVPCYTKDILGDDSTSEEWDYPSTEDKIPLEEIEIYDCDYSLIDEELIKVLDNALYCKPTSSDLDYIEYLLSLTKGDLCANSAIIINDIYEAHGRIEPFETEEEIDFLNITDLRRALLKNIDIRGEVLVYSPLVLKDSILTEQDNYKEILDTYLAILLSYEENN